VSLTLQILVSGFAAGGVYGLFGVGHAVVYRLTGVVHLALGDLVALAVFTTLFVAAGTGPLTQSSGGARFWLGLLVGFAVCLLAGAGGYLAAIQPYLARGWTVGWVAATLALGFAVRALLEAAFPRPSYVFPDPLRIGRIGNDGVVDVAGASVQIRSLFVIGVVVALAAAAAWLLERTRFGRALHAVAADADGARFVGIPVERYITLAFALAGGLAALGAIAAAPAAPFDVQTGALLGLKGLAAAVVVGFASPWRALAAGVAFGVLEATIANADLGGLSLGPSYREVVPFALVLFLLALRPFAEAAHERE
jgi:branched-subunit amino acid ABC-type transport system permease component